MLNVQVRPSQAPGCYSVTLSGDEFSSYFRFFGTAEEIRVLIADLRERLSDAEHPEYLDARTGDRHAP